MALSTFRTIVVEWPDPTGPKLKEALAAAAIGPGELLNFDANDALILHATAAGLAPTNKLVAVESPMAATGTSNDAIDTDYASGDTVQYVVPLRGAVLYMYLASGENVAKGDPLTSDGSGALEAVSLGTALMPDSIVAYAYEDKDASGGLARILAEAA